MGHKGNYKNTGGVRMQKQIAGIKPKKSKHKSSHKK